MTELCEGTGTVGLP